MANVVMNEFTDDEDDTSHVQGQHSRKLSTDTSSQHRPIEPSYQAKENLKSVLLLSQKPSDVNEVYNRSRRYDNAGKYRIDPTFITKAKLSYMDENKPGKLSVVPDESRTSNLEFGLLTYLWTFTDQHDKHVIDLGFLKSLVDSGVSINSRDQHGQTILHAIVRDWHSDVALFLIRSNADVNAQDQHGRSPLHLAAALNNLEMVEVLLRNGANVNLETAKERQTPVHYAAKYNSLDALKLLIKYNGSITKRDYKDRTALYLTAEKGSAETAQFLLDIGAPIGVYDVNGVSALACLVERIPNVAYRALEQFQTTNTSLKQSYMYLSHLETDTLNKGRESMKFARTPLEIIAAYNDLDLVMHPVIQKCIEIKWKLFGKMDTMKRLFITLVYLCCWLVLSYTYSDNGEYYYTKTQPKVWHTHSWKIVFEALIIVFAVYFFLKEFLIKKEAIQHHHRWMEWKQHVVKAQLIFCHPAWPGEREAVEAEAERIRTVPTLAGKQKFWFAYEFMILLCLATSIILRICTMSVGGNKALYMTAKCLFTINMMFSFLRMLKICIRFRFFSVFLKVTGLAVASFIQIGFLYLQFYVPFVAAFWLMFGGEAGVELAASTNTTDSVINHKDFSEEQMMRLITSLQKIFYFIYESSFGQESVYLFTKMDNVAAQILISLYHLFSSFIALSIFIAFVTSQFTTNYKRCVAEASLLQAAVVLEVEKGLKKRDQKKVRRYYTKFCTPLVTSLWHTNDDIRERDAVSKLAMTERHITGVEKGIRDAEERHRRNDKKRQGIVLDNIFEYSAALTAAQQKFGEKFEKELKEIAQKQEYMNKYLSKLL